MQNNDINIRASIFLSSYFETLGFNNGNWEFNYENKSIFTIDAAASMYLNIVHDFFSKGGLKNMNVKGWNSSDDTLLIIYTIKALLNGGSVDNFIDSYTSGLNELKMEKRISGVNTLNTLQFIRVSRDINKIKYDTKMGGNGAAVRTGPIGLFFNKEKDIPKLIETAIISSRVSHNFYKGFLGGLVTAMFTNFAYRKLNITTWITELFKYQEDIKKYMKKTNIYKEYLEDEEGFFYFWKMYQEKKVNYYQERTGGIEKFSERMESLKDFFDFKEEENYSLIGSSGLSATIFAYDCFLMAHTSDKIPYDLENLSVSLDSLIFYSTLHFGDNDSTGAIVGSWYGAMYGFDQFDQEKLKQLEFYEEIDSLVNAMVIAK